RGDGRHRRPGPLPVPPPRPAAAVGHVPRLVHHAQLRLAATPAAAPDRLRGKERRPAALPRPDRPRPRGQAPSRLSRGAEGAARRRAAPAPECAHRAGGENVNGPPPLIDTHAHLDDDRFRDDLPAVLERAKAAGVCRVVTVATTAATSAVNVGLAARHADILSATVGIQPNHVAEAGPGDWDEVVRLVTAPGVVALGETGLDRYWDRTPFPQQEDYFARHLDLARRHNLPVVIHCRDAEADVVRMLRQDFDQHGPVRGVMHSFTGTRET